MARDDPLKGLAMTRRKRSGSRARAPRARTADPVSLHAHRGGSMLRLTAPFAALAIAVPAFAQEPVRTDTTGRDTTRVTRRPELEVTVTRTAEPLTRVPFAVGVLERDDLQRGQQTIGIDEALNDIPGVVV